MATQRKKILGRAAALTLSLLGGAASVEAQSPPATQADILIKNGHVVDGTGAPWFQANVAITGDRIVYVGRAPVTAKRVIDAGGKVVSPGFIDMHAHSEFGLSLDGRALSKITQGVTTEVMGEHLSAGPVLGPAVDDPMMVTPPVKRSWTTLGGFFSYLQKKGIGLNVASYIGAGQVRASAMGYQNRQPTPAEMDRIKQLIRQGMEEGAFGLSNGMSYVPNMFFDTAQLIELCKVAGSYGGIFTIHIRNVAPGDPRDKGLKEAIEIAKGAHIPVEIFHLGASAGMDPDDFIRDVQQARDDGVDITGNSYPYETGWTYLTQSLPAWAQEGDSAAIVARLQKPDTRARILAEMKDRDFSTLKVASVNPDFDGKHLTQIAAEMHVSPQEALLNILVKHEGRGLPDRASDRQPRRDRHPDAEQSLDGHRLGRHLAAGRCAHLLRQPASALLRQPYKAVVGICARTSRLHRGGSGAQDDLAARRPAGAGRSRHPASGHEGRCGGVRSRHRQGHGDL